MDLSPEIARLLKAYRRAESDSARGPRFKKLAMSLEQEIAELIARHALLN